jgi:hypothetical protein
LREKIEGLQVELKTAGKWHDEYLEAMENMERLQKEVDESDRERKELESQRVKDEECIADLKVFVVYF